MGILQRVAVCYYAVALMEIFLPRATQFDVASAKSVMARAGALFARCVCIDREQTRVSLIERKGD
jgi:predicted acyltransferase